MADFIEIDAMDVGVNSAALNKDLDGSLQRSVSGGLFSNVHRAYSVYNYSTILHNETKARALLAYLGGRGECFPFESPDTNYFHYSNKGNSISAVSGTVNSTVNAFFANTGRSLQVSSGGHAEFSTVLGPRYTVIVQYGGNSISGSGNWNTIAMSTAHPNGGVYGGEFSTSDIRVNNHITIVGGKVRLRGRHPSGASNAVAYYNRLVIIHEEIDLSTGVLAFVAGQGGAAAGAVPYAGEYPNLKINDSGHQLVGKCDPGSLSLNFAYGGDTVLAEVSFSLLQGIN